jgi:uncharacterized protein YqgV (UPF0045/DUF77 family)
MTTRTYTTKSGTIFEWEETNELLELLKQLHQPQSQEQQQVPRT